MPSSTAQITPRAYTWLCDRAWAPALEEEQGWKLLRQLSKRGASTEESGGRNGGSSSPFSYYLRAEAHDPSKGPKQVVATWILLGRGQTTPGLVNCLCQAVEY